MNKFEVIDLLETEPNKKCFDGEDLVNKRLHQKLSRIIQTLRDVSKNL